jgi:Zn finger protein HypA/HybF involved in hydrogenase expression
MKKSELKEIIKPIVQECVRESVEEILLESGLLSSVIKEVMKGALPVITEASRAQTASVQQAAKTKPPVNNELMEQIKRERQEVASEFRKQNEQISKTLSMKVGGVDVFKGTSPAPATVQESVADPLGGISPNDPGVDISRLFGGKKFNVS